VSIHTLIPEAHSYGIAILVIFGLSSFSLALHIHSHALAGKRISFWVIHNGVMTFTIVWGLLLFDIRQIVGNAPITWIISIPLGIVAGWVAGWSDRTIIRYLLRRQLVLRNASLRNRRTDIRQTQNDWNLPVRSNHVPIATRLAKRRIISLHKGQQSFQPSLEYQQFGLWSIIITAVLEELIYRGFLVKVCFLLPNSFLIGIALVGIILAFSLAHIQFGWPHVLAKLPLSTLTMIIVLALGTVLPAIVAHIVFNISVWKDKRSQPVFLGPHEQS
jgi:hypothetical protein